jgi:predicted dehydrogenase
MAPFRLMIWGAGFFTRKWLEAIAAREDVEVVGIASRTTERVEELRRDFKLSGATAYKGWEEAAERGQADGVLITLPQMFHPEATTRALKAGLHVLVEKPLALEMAGARAVYEEAGRHPNQIAMVDQNFRWRPHVQALRKAVQDGLVGRIGHLMIECRQQIRRTTVGGWREKMPDPYLLDFAIHHFDMMRYVTGDEAVRVIGQSFRPSWSWLEGNPAAGAIVTMRNGAVVDYGGTMVSLGLETPQEGLVTVIGEKGTLHMDGKSQVNLLGQGDPRILPQEPIPGGELGYSLAEFLGAIREKRRPKTCVGEHIKSLALTIAAVESSRRGCVVELAEFTEFLPK